MKVPWCGCRLGDLEELLLEDSSTNRGSFGLVSTTCASDGRYAFLVPGIFVGEPAYTATEAHAASVTHPRASYISLDHMWACQLGCSARLKPATGLLTALLL